MNLKKLSEEEKKWLKKIAQKSDLLKIQTHRGGGNKRAINWNELRGILSMKINLSNFETSDVSLFDVSIVQRDVGGGKTEKEDIDCLEEYPTAKSLIISGLNQECFEYLIKHYGSQFEAISFWKNKSVSDLSPLEDLTNVKFIHFFFNQKATDLWNMERNEKLSGLSIYDFPNYIRL